MENWQEKLEMYKKLIRWDRPIGTFLLLWPTLSALWLAGKGKPQAAVVFIFILGVICTRAAGCIINDILDRNFDRHVERTQLRPLAQKQISVKEALGICLALLSLSLMLVLLLNRLSFIIALFSLMIMAIYPLMKRFFPWPQVILGAIFNGVLMAFAAVQNTIPWSGWLLYCIAWLWTVSYDSLYAMADRSEDLSLGLKSTAIYFGEKLPRAVLLLQLIILVLLCLLGLGNSLNRWYYLGVGATGITFLYQQYLIKELDPTLCFKAFLNNNWSWLFLFSGIVLNYLA